MTKILEWLWGLLPDQCEVSDCCRKGVRGNENRIPFTVIDEDFYIIMCDYCTTRYHAGELMVIDGLPLQLRAPRSKVVPILEARRKKRRDRSTKIESG